MGCFGVDFVLPFPGNEWDYTNSWRQVVWYDTATEDLAAKLRQIREALHLTRFRTGDTYRSVAEEVGCSPQQLSGFEKGTYDARLSLLQGVVAYIDKNAEKAKTEDDVSAQSIR